MIRSTPLITLIYSILVILLGYTGYLQAKSLISLIVAGTLGSIIIISLVSVALTKKDWPYYIMMTDVLILLGFFGYKFWNTQGFSWGIMAAFSFLTLSLISIKVFSHREI